MLRHAMPTGGEPVNLPTPFLVKAGRLFAIVVHVKSTLHVL